MSMAIPDNDHDKRNKTKRTRLQAMQASSTTTTIITPKDVYVQQHAFDQQTVQILQKLHGKGVEPWLQELLSRG